MTRLPISIIVCLSAVVFDGPMRDSQSTAQGQSGAQTPGFRSGTSAVAVDVSVRDKSRRIMLGLTANDFVVADNGVRQEVVEVSYGTLPIDVTIGLDVSASVTGSVLDSLRRSVVQLMGDLRKEDRLKLLLFSNDVHRAVDFTTDVKAVENAMRRVPAGGGTALHDAISVALVGASAPDRRQLVVFFTDGADSGSAISTALLQTVAERTRATLTFALSVTNQTMYLGSVGAAISSATGQSVDPLFGRLASETGGTVVTVDGSTVLGSIFRRILDEFRSTYVLFYSPKGVERTGFHAITVDVLKPGAIVQARRGYFGG